MMVVVMLVLMLLVVGERGSVLCSWLLLLREDIPSKSEFEERQLY